MAMEVRMAGVRWTSTRVGPVPSAPWQPSCRPWSRRTRWRAPSPLLTAESSWRSALAFGAAEHGDHLAVLARHAQQLPAAFAHVGAPADELLPLLGRGPEDAQVGDRLPVRRVRFGRHGERRR